MGVAGRNDGGPARGGGPREVPAARRSREQHAPRGDPGGRPARQRLDGGDGGRPLAPGEGRRMVIEIQRARIDIKAVVSGVRGDEAGAIVVFLGSVRSDPEVQARDYEVYKPMALRTLTELVERAKEKFGALEMSIVHRVGRVPVGGDSVVLACAAAHRSEAFAACAWAMDEVKRIVPIWKTEAGPRTPRSRR